MYFYVYDSFLQDKKYAKLLTDLEARIIDLGIQGRMSKLNILNDLRELIKDAVKRGAETVVVVGDDKTLCGAIAAVAPLDVTLGAIPVGSNDFILTHYLGIPSGVAACDVLSKRVKERIDVAKVDGNFFSFYLKTQSPFIKIVSPDREYSITPITHDAEVYICNFKPGELMLDIAQDSPFFIPNDGQLEVVVKRSVTPSFIDKIFSKQSQTVGDYTLLPVQKIILESSDLEQDVRIMLDGYKVIKPPVTVEVIPRKISIVVGTMRKL